MREFADTIFRANSSYQLVLLDRLSHIERKMIGGLEDADDLYGVLRPCQGSQLELRSASRDTALLLLTLKDPGPIPEYLRADLGANFSSVITKLVLDEVLEVQHGGSFVSGVNARNLVLASTTERECGRIAELSIEALQYGQALEGLTAQDLALRLYFYGRKPVSSLWLRRLASEESIRRYLGLIVDGAAQVVLDTSWTEVGNQDERSYWRMWHPRRGGSGSKTAGYKLYVSVDCASLPDVLPAVAESLAYARGVRGFKIGRDVFGLCRPDNFVAYFSRLEDLRIAASRIESRLAGCKVQGVPFTAEVTRDGMMSWGIDPPPECQSPQGRSWRFWVVDRLAQYLLAAKAADVAEPWRFALDRLSVDGIDTNTWVPMSRIWNHSMAIG